ncbi:MAG: hypothetical protein HF981_09810 [Desulfobacteraceae bacterium]|nr:hypothetical protein [Desulfobacteraceae bacterium]MBC2750669.1 hypothetical protein [Desulfobacteraceae bacterium]
MGFIRRQEEKLAARLIQWHQQQQADASLSPEELSQKASLLVDEAHRVARHRGQNVLTIMKEMVADVLKK